MKTIFQEGDAVEVFVRDITPNTAPGWQPAKYIGMTGAGFIQVQIQGRRRGTMTLRAFNAEDVRKPIEKP